MHKIDKRIAIAWLAGHTSAGSDCCGGPIHNIASYMAIDLKTTSGATLKVLQECETLLGQMFEGWLEDTPPTCKE